MLNDFKTFALRGNVIDLAVGVMIGGAFGAIVQSLVKDILMPPIGLLIGNVDFSNLFIVLKAGTVQAGPYLSVEAAQKAGAVTLNIGLFLNATISFTIMALAIFLLVRALNKLQKPASAPVAAPDQKTCPYCLSSVAEAATRCPHCTSTLT
jgi:large conductance mechanosensitive channel